MDKNKINLDNNKLNKLISYANHLVKLLYVLFIVGIILVTLIVLKELKITSLIFKIIKVLFPLFIGFIIAWLFNPLVLKIENKGLPKIVSALIIYFILIFFIFIFFKVFIPVLYKQVNDLVKVLPSTINSLSKALDNISLKFLKEGIDIGNFKDNILGSIKSYTTSFSSNLPTYVINITKSFFSIIGVVLMGFVVGIYMILDYDNLYNRCVKIFPKKWCKDINELIKTISEEVRKTVNGTLLVALMVFVGDTIAFTILGLDSPLLFGLLCGITDLIPFIGPYIGGSISTIVAFTKSTPIGIGVLIACVIVQLIENYILQPVVMSKATKINPLIIISSLLIFGKFFGIFGMIIATPLLAILKVIYEYICQKKKNKYISDC